LEKPNDTSGSTRADQEKVVGQTSEDTFRLLVEGVKDYAIVMVEPDGQIASWNTGAEHLTGYRSEEAIGKHVSILYGNDDVEMSKLLDLARLNGTSEAEGFRRRKDGSQFWAHTVINSLQDRSGRLIGFSEITRDLTERRSYELALRDMNSNLERLVQERTADLEAANRELEAFSYSVSHDLRAPLRSIDGFSKVLLEDFGDRLDPEIKRNLDIIIRNATRMGTLIDDLLRFSRLNRTPMITTIADMRSIALSVFNEVKEQAPERKIKLTVLSIPAARVDRAMIRQVFHNLLSNAVKFSSNQKEAEIEVGSYRKDAACVYYIKDNGVGFDMKYVGKLFGPFQRLHKSTEFPGSGIGLALVQRIVHRHGGAVWIQSAIDRGTTVYFTVPPSAQLEPDTPQEEVRTAPGGNIDG
jgi:PAS domain S-box-containing protein